MTKSAIEKKYCYRYHDGNDNEGRPIVTLWKRLIIRETDKTFWHVEDFPYMRFEQVVSYWMRCHKKDQKLYIKRCAKGACRSRYHYTKEEALEAFIHRKKFQLARIRLTAETISLILTGLEDAGHITYSTNQYGFKERNIVSVPDSECFVASDETGPIASTYNWGEY